MLSKIGTISLKLFEGLGVFGLFSFNVLKTFFQKGCKYKAFLLQVVNVGVESTEVIVITGAAIGAVLALHGYGALHQYGTDQFLGQLEYLSMTREFGSVISAIMVIARCGSAMTAEIGSMSISEQLAALTTLSVDPIRYVVIPRVLGTTFVMPLLNLFCVIFGVGAGYIVSVYIFGVSSELYVESIKTSVVLGDITKGMLKAAVFGLLASLICTFKGMTVRGGARDIGISTTKSVVYSCVTVFISDYVLSSILFRYE